MTAKRQVVGDGMVRKAIGVNQGGLLVDKVGVHGRSPEEPSEQESERP